jgi:two-component system sensor histidine kinase CpxA
MSLVTMLRKLNPFRTLYGRIFLWFWLATLVMIASSIWLVKQLSEEPEYKPLRKPQLVEMERIKDKLQSRLTGAGLEGLSTKEKLHQQIQRFGRRNQKALVLLDPRDQSFIYGIPPGMRPPPEPFLELINQPSPFSIHIGRAIYNGPISLNVDQQTYLLFIGRPSPQGGVQQMHRRHPGLMIGVALLISGFLCFLLAWSLVMPIKQLQQAAQRMANGDLRSRVSSASKRNDELGQLARDFNHMAQQLENLLNSQNRLLGDISHELRSPLARLQLAIGIAQQQPASEQTKITSKQLERIEKESGQIEAMIAQLLILTKLESAKKTIQMEKISLTELLKDLLEDSQFEADDLHKHIQLKCTEDIFLQANARLLSSALENILRNAVHYSRTSADVSVTRDLNTVKISISDDGTGIPEAELQKIFEPFYRVSVARERESGGVGLGLSIAYRAIQTHGGEIHAFNNEKAGLQLIIHLPIEPRQ